MRATRFVIALALALSFGGGAMAYGQGAGNLCRFVPQGQHRVLTGTPGSTDRCMATFKGESAFDIQVIIYDAGGPETAAKLVKGAPAAFSISGNKPVRTSPVPGLGDDAMWIETSALTVQTVFHHGRLMVTVMSMPPGGLYTNPQRPANVDAAIRRLASAVEASLQSAGVPGGGNRPSNADAQQPGTVTHDPPRQPTTSNRPPASGSTNTTSQPPRDDDIMPLHEGIARALGEDNAQRGLGLADFNEKSRAWRESADLASELTARLGGLEGKRRSLTEQERKIVNTLRTIVWVADVHDPNGKLLFPSLRFLTPVAAKLAERAVNDPGAFTALERMITYVASLDDKARQCGKTPC